MIVCEISQRIRLSIQKTLVHLSQCFVLHVLLQLSGAKPLSVLDQVMIKLKSSGFIHFRFVLKLAS